ncbi:MAG TPA: NfeD family protein [Solirubrobacterales bacterium]|nr:NfeD family protein [Solirubrobacterales bacterium]
MEAFVIVALIGFGLLLAELLLPTGGVLAAIGVAGLTAAGIIALDSDSITAEYIGGALIALGVVSAASFYFITRKVIAAHRDSRVRTGTEEMVGSSAEARSAIDPDGRAWLGGTIWSARLAPGSEPVRAGDRVRVEAVDGLTLVVRPEPQTAVQPKQGAR